MTEDKILDRVRKLLAQAERAGTEQEAETFNEKAAQLIAQHGIDRALLAQAGEIRDEITRVRIPIENPYGRDKGDLLNDIANAFRCRTVYHQYRRSLVSMTVIGFESDLDRVELLYTSLLLQATSQLTRVRPEPGWGYESTRAYRISWMRGFRVAVYKRLTAAEQRAAREADQAQPGTGTELVLVDREARVKQALADAFPTLGKVAKRTYTGSGYHDGHQAGQRADIGATNISGRDRDRGRRVEG